VRPLVLDHIKLTFFSPVRLFALSASVDLSRQNSLFSSWSFAPSGYSSSESPVSLLQNGQGLFPTLSESFEFGISY